MIDASEIIDCGLNHLARNIGITDRQALPEGTGVVDEDIETASGFS